MRLHNTTSTLLLLVVFAAAACAAQLYIFYKYHDQTSSRETSTSLQSEPRFPFASTTNMMPIVEDNEGLLHRPLPRPLELPSVSNPFVFFHLRKCGGSSFRTSIAAAANQHNLTFVIPCQERAGGGDRNVMLLAAGTNHRRSCHTYHLDVVAGMVRSYRTVKELSIVAGHFYYDSLSFLLSNPPQIKMGSSALSKKSPTLLTSTTSSQLNNYNNYGPFSCIVMVRDQIEQFLSCYKERFEPHLHKKVLDLSPGELEEALESNTEPHMPHGCSNEIARWLSPAWSDMHANRGWLSLEEIDETKRRLTGCTITNIVHRHNDTMRIIAYWHPWLTGHYHGVNSGHRAKAKNHAVLKALSPEAMALIRRHNALDLELYKFAMARFDLQVAKLENNANHS